jgi:hypothetical protein
MLIFCPYRGTEVRETIRLTLIRQSLIDANHRWNIFGQAKYVMTEDSAEHLGWYLGSSSTLIPAFVMTERYVSTSAMTCLYCSSEDRLPSSVGQAPTPTFYKVGLVSSHVACGRTPITIHIWLSQCDRTGRILSRVIYSNTAVIQGYLSRKSGIFPEDG